MDYNFDGKNNRQRRVDVPSMLVQTILKYLPDDSKMERIEIIKIALLLSRSFHNSIVVRGCRRDLLRIYCILFSHLLGHRKQRVITISHLDSQMPKY